MKSKKLDWSIKTKADEAALIQVICIFAIGFILGVLFGLNIYALI